MKNKDLGFLLVAVSIYLAINVFLPSRFNGYSFDLGIDFTELINNQTAFLEWQSRWIDPVFGKRIILLYLQEIANEEFQIPHQLSFTVVNFFSLLGCFYFIHKVRNYWGLGKSYQVLSIFLLFFPITFSMTPLMGGYDDLLQWAFCSAIIYYTLKQKTIFALFLLGAAILIRETSLIFLPFVLFYHKNTRKRYFLFAICVLSLAGYFLLQIGNNDLAIENLFNQRFSALKENFSTLSQASTSLISLIVVVGFPMYLMTSSQPIINHKDWQKYRNFTTYTLVVFAAIASLTSLLQEARIIALAILLIIPFTKELIPTIQLEKHSIFTIMVIVVLAICIAFIFYNPPARKSTILYQTYLCFTLLYMGLIINSRKRY